VFTTHNKGTNSKTNKTQYKIKTHNKKKNQNNITRQQ